MINICGGGRKGRAYKGGLYVHEGGPGLGKEGIVLARKERCRRWQPLMIISWGFRSSYQPTVEDRQRIRGGKYPLISPHECSTFLHHSPRSYLPHLDVITLNPNPASSLLRPSINVAHISSESSAYITRIHSCASPHTTHYRIRWHTAASLVMISAVP